MSKPEWTGERLEQGIMNESTIEHLHRYAIARELSPGKTVLDLACGDGYGTNLISQKAQAVTGVDINSTVINKARSTYTGKNINFLQGAVENIPVEDQTADIVVCFEAIEHTLEHEKMLTEVKRVLKNEGLLILSTPDKKNYSDTTGFKNPFHVRELYREQLVELLSKYFNQVEIFGQRVSITSIINNEASESYSFYTGDFNTIEPSAHKPVYYLALASDKHLPTINNSIFEGHSIFETALAERETLVKKTISYRVGHTLLWPFKIIRKLLKN